MLEFCYRVRVDGVAIRVLSLGIQDNVSRNIDEAGQPRENSNQPNSGEEADQIFCSAPAAAAVLHTVRYGFRSLYPPSDTPIPSLPSVVPCAFCDMPNIHIADR